MHDLEVPGIGAELAHLHVEPGMSRAELCGRSVEPEPFAGPVRHVDQGRTALLDELAHLSSLNAATECGTNNELASLAFSFAPANDSNPDPMLEKLKAQGLGSLEPKFRETHSININGPLAASFRMMALAGSLFLENLFHWPFPPNSGDTQSNRS